MLSPVSTWMGDRLGTLGAVGIKLLSFHFFSFFTLGLLNKWNILLTYMINTNWFKNIFYVILSHFTLLARWQYVLFINLLRWVSYFSYINSKIDVTSRQRPYHIEHTSSRPITEVKQCWSRLVLGWVTAMEHWVLLASNFFFFLLMNRMITNDKESFF